MYANIDAAMPSINAAPHSNDGTPQSLHLAYVCLPMLSADCVICIFIFVILCCFEIPSCVF